MEGASLCKRLITTVERIIASMIRGRPYWWLILALLVPGLQATFLVVVKLGATPTHYTNRVEIISFVTLLLACGLAAVNAFQSTRAIRLFWSFFALACGSWSLNEWSWIYYLGIKGQDHPEFVLATAPLYLHIVFLAAAVLSRPHLRSPQHRPYRTTLNFLILLFFWVFLYSFAILPISYMEFDSAHVTRTQFVYSSQNILLLAIVSGVALKAQPPWKAIYLHLFGASILYAISSFFGHLLLGTGSYLEGWDSLGYWGAAYWFGWIALEGLRNKTSLSQSVELDSTNPKYWSTLALLVLIAIPIVGLWELYRPGETEDNRTIRLFVVLVAVLVLGVIAFLTENFTTQQLSSNVAALSGRLIHAHDEERSRIARDIHDDYQQRVALLVIHLEALAKDVEGEALPRLRELRGNVRELGADLHALSHMLHSSTLDKLGLVAGIRGFCREFAGQQDIQIDFAHENVLGAIPRDVALCLFRIAQEGLRNVKRHSGADRAEVRLEGFGEKLHLSISDRGRGFDSNDLGFGGIGIQSMVERLRLLGGTLEVHSRPLKGTRIDAWLPIEIASLRMSQTRAMSTGTQKDRDQI